MNESKILWQPSQEFIDQSNLNAYQDWLHEEKGICIYSYDDLWKWSVDKPELFWQTIVEYYKVIFHKSPDQILEGRVMPDMEWFPGSTLNFVEHIFRNKSNARPALIWKSEAYPLKEISWTRLEQEVASFASFLKAQGIEKGDRVAGFITNSPHATIAFLAAASLGAVWSSCSPDFGADSVKDRFAQIEPKVLVAVDGYSYNGKTYDKTAVVNKIVDEIDTIQKVVHIPFMKGHELQQPLKKSVSWPRCVENTDVELEYNSVPFSHPLWVLYSSGTTGNPKAITHSHGGILLEHLKYLGLQNDLKAGERYFWYSTTGWMMWNFIQGVLLHGGTPVLYDGSAAYPDLNAMWKFVQEAEIDHFGTSAPFLVACMKDGEVPTRDIDLSKIRSLSSTGAPLPPEAFDWIYRKVKSDLWLCSMSGGTDVCTAFIGGNPFSPVHEGEIQGRALGCALYAWDDAGNPVIDEVGEMVITKPMPSMPVFFWNDPGNDRYKDSYFDTFPNVWRHGDWVKVTDHGSLIIYGRSDATLNRHGVRIGTAEIYRALNDLKEIKDSLIVNLELSGGEHYMPLFVVLNEGYSFDKSLIKQIGGTLRKKYSPRHVPDEVIPVQDIPYTISGKKMEAPVKKILLGMPLESSINLGAMRNPESIDFFVGFQRKMNK
jgi:acetoacetyl-CoA synthetase